MTKKRVVIVLGMHRSGTSAIARGLKALSIELGDNLLPPVEGNNDRGFWEDRDIYRLNERLLAKCASGWDRLSRLDEPLLLQDAFAPERREAAILLDRKTSKSPVFGFKDPRTSILLPFWKCVFEDLALEQSCIVAVRNPFEVAESLFKRDKLDPEIGLGLWLKYSWSSIVHSASMPRIAVSYSRLVEDPGGELARVASAFGLSAPSPASPEFIEYAGEFLSQELRHNRVSDNEVLRAQTIPPPIPDLYQRLLRWSECSPGEDLEIPSRLKSKVESYLAQSQSALALADRLKLTADTQTSKAVAAEKSRQELKVYAEQLQARLADKEKSVASLQLSQQDTQRLYLDAKSSGEILTARLEAADQKLAAAKADLDQRDKAIADLKQVNQAADQKLAAAKADLDQRDKAIADLKQVNQAADQKLAAAKADLDQHARDLTSVRAQSEADRVRLDSALEAEALLRQQAQNEARRLGAALKASEFDWKEKLRTEVTQKVSQANAQLSAEYGQVVERLKSELAEQSASARLLKQEVIEMRSSTSWRITRPARAIASRLGRKGSSASKLAQPNKQMLSSPED